MDVLISPRGRSVQRKHLNLILFRSFWLRDQVSHMPIPLVIQYPVNWSLTLNLAATGDDAPTLRSAAARADAFPVKASHAGPMNRGFYFTLVHRHRF